MIKHLDHECLIGDAIPLAGEPVVGSQFESKSGIVLGMSKDDDEGATRSPEVFEPMANKLGPNSTPLAARIDGHGGQAHANDR